MRCLGDLGNLCTTWGGGKMIGDLDSLGHLILVILLLELYKGGQAR